MSNSTIDITEKKTHLSKRTDITVDSGYSCRGRAFTRPASVGFTRMLIGSLAFVLLTVGIVWYQFQRVQPGDDVPGLADVRWEYLLLMLLCLPLDTLAGGIRIWVVGRVIQPRLTFWTCMKSEWANMGVSMLTPSQTGGGFGQIYMLKRGGASVATAITVSLISFLGTIMGLFCVGLYFVLDSGVAFGGPLFGGAILTFTVICVLMLFGAFFPVPLRFSIFQFSRMVFWMRNRTGLSAGRFLPYKTGTDHSKYPMGRLASWLMGLASNYHQGVRLFLTKGKAHLALVLLLTLTFMLSRSLMAFLCLRTLGIDGSSLGHVLEVQLALIVLVYFAPTPGASGFAEGASLALMGSIIPVGFAPYYNMLWRCATLFLPGMAGLLCLLPIMVRDARGIVRHRIPHANEHEEGNL